MKAKVVFLLTILALGLLLLSGCSDKTKDNPTRPTYSQTGQVAVDNFHSFSIFFSTMNNPLANPREQGNKPYRIYLPPGYFLPNGSIGGPFPILYLFPPFGADEQYYFEHGLATVADRLISEGKMVPMIIVSIDGRSLLGGSFYTDSPRQGKYFSALYSTTVYDWPTVVSGSLTLDTLPYTAVAFLTRIDGIYNTIAQPKFRAAGGVGMGGYGAFKSVLQTDYFGSVSAIDAPLDFDGSTGNGGFLTLFQDVYDGSWNTVDTSETNIGMSIVVSAAAAFSPHHTGFNVDSIYFDNFGSLALGYTITDTLAADASTLVAKHAIHVPFDNTGAINSDIWGLWLGHNVDSLYENAAALSKANFVDMKKLLITVDDSKYRFDEQMSGFMQFLDANGMEYQQKNYSGSDVLSGTADHYLYDIFEDILIFHSDNFKAAGY